MRKDLEEIDLDALHSVTGGFGVTAANKHQQPDMQMQGASITGPTGFGSSGGGLPFGIGQIVGHGTDVGGGYGIIAVPHHGMVSDVSTVDHADRGDANVSAIAAATDPGIGALGGHDMSMAQQAQFDSHGMSMAEQAQLQSGHTSMAEQAQTQAQGQQPGHLVCGTVHPQGAAQQQAASSPAEIGFASASFDSPSEAVYAEAAHGHALNSAAASFVHAPVVAEVHGIMPTQDLPDDGPITVSAPITGEAPVQDAPDVVPEHASYADVHGDGSVVDASWGNNSIHVGANGDFQASIPMLGIDATIADGNADVSFQGAEIHAGGGMQNASGGGAGNGTGGGGGHCGN